MTRRDTAAGLPGAGPERDRLREVYREVRSDPRFARDDRAHAGLLARLEHDIRAELAHAGRLPLPSGLVVEVGCGSGHWLRHLVAWGAAPTAVLGFDMLMESLGEARPDGAGGPFVGVADGVALPLRSGSVSLVFQSTVFSSVLHAGRRQALADEMRRVLAPGGLILWYDLARDNPWNPAVVGIPASAVRDLFPGCRVRLHRVTLAPPICRVAARRLPGIVPLLERVPWLRSHLLGTIAPGGAGAGPATGQGPRPA